MSDIVNASRRPVNVVASEIILSTCLSQYHTDCRQFDPEIQGYIGGLSYAKDMHRGILKACRAVTFSYAVFVGQNQQPSHLVHVAIEAAESKDFSLLTII